MGHCQILFGDLTLWKDAAAVWSGTFSPECVLAAAVASTALFEHDLDRPTLFSFTVYVESRFRSLLQFFEGGPTPLLCGVVDLVEGKFCVDLWHLLYTIWRGGITGTLHVIGEVSFGMFRNPGTMGQHLLQNILRNLLHTI